MVGSVRKKLLWVLVGLAVLGVVAGAVIIMQLGRIVKAGVETVGPRIAKVPVVVQAVHVSLLRGSFAVEGLEVGNPEGFDSPHSFSVRRIAVDARLPSFLSDEIVIPSIVVEKPDITLELSGTRTNIGEILKNVERPPKETEPKPKKKLRVGVILIEGATVTMAGLPGSRSVSLPLPRVEVTDLQTGGQAATPQQVVSRTLAALYESVIGVAGQALSPEQVGTLKGDLSDALKSGRQTLEAGGRKAEEAAGQVQKGLESIFKKK